MCLLVFNRLNSDTTGNTLACALYYLVANPFVYKTLQRQIDEMFPGGDKSYDYAKVKSLSHLDAILKETMRLKAAVPGGQPRVTPPEGLQVGSIWVPGDVNVLVP
jgi:cytochrome P450